MASVPRAIQTRRTGDRGADSGTPEASSLRGHCKCPLGKLQGPSAADLGNPSKCGQRRSLIPAPSRFTSSSVMGVVWPKRPASAFIFQTCHRFPGVTDPLIPPSHSLRFVLGVIQGLAARVFRAIVCGWLCVTLWGMRSLSHCSGTLGCVHVYTHRHTPLI